MFVARMARPRYASHPLEQIADFGRSRNDRGCLFTSLRFPKKRIGLRRRTGSRRLPPLRRNTRRRFFSVSPMYFAHHSTEIDPEQIEPRVSFARNPPPRVSCPCRSVRAEKARLAPGPRLDFSAKTPIRPQTRTRLLHLQRNCLQSLYLRGGATRCQPKSRPRPRVEQGPANAGRATQTTDLPKIGCRFFLP